MRILVVNAGSSSLKSQLIETDGKVSLMKCLAEKVGTPDAYMNVSFAPDFQKATYRVADMTVAECLKKLLEVLVDDPESPISDLSQIDAIGNRIVAGGEYFTKSVIIDESAREKLELCEELAPLHNPPADACIDMMAALMPNTTTTASAATAPTARATATRPSRRRTCSVVRCAIWASSRAIWATAAPSRRSTTGSPSTPPWASRRWKVWLWEPAAATSTRRS